MYLYVTGCLKYCCSIIYWSSLFFQLNNPTNDDWIVSNDECVLLLVIRHLLSILYFNRNLKKWFYSLSNIFVFQSNESNLQNIVSKARFNGIESLKFSKKRFKSLLVLIFQTFSHFTQWHCLISKIAIFDAP